MTLFYDVLSACVINYYTCTQDNGIISLKAVLLRACFFKEWLKGRSRVIKVFVSECFRSHLKCNFFLDYSYFAPKFLCISVFYFWISFIIFLFRMYFIYINSNHPFYLNAVLWVLPFDSVPLSFFSCVLEWPICDKNGLSIAAIFSQISDFPS